MATIVDIDDTLLRNGTQPIKRVIDYINKIHPAKQMYTFNFTMRKQLIDEERAILDENENKISISISSNKIFLCLT